MAFCLFVYNKDPIIVFVLVSEYLKEKSKHYTLWHFLSEKKKNNNKMNKTDGLDHRACHK